MKLRKIIPYLDGGTSARLYIDDEIVWEGSTLSLQAAADIRGEGKHFLKDCWAMEDFDIIYEVVSAIQYLGYKLDTDNIDYEAVSMCVYTNKYNVNLIRLDISLLPKKK